MIEQAPPTAAPSTRFGPDPQDFLTSHRAQAVAIREFNRVAEALGAEAKRLATLGGHDKPVVRVAPDRCIVQLGPVALTAAHLRTGPERPGGQLLVIVWKGIIAARGDHIPERLGARHVPVPPVSRWEETFLVSAQSEATWHWHPNGLQQQGFTSIELAERCMTALSGELQDAVEELNAMAAATTTPEVA
jgi:hypothetical protein